MPTLSSIIAPGNVVTTDNELTLTNKTLTDPIIQYVAGDTSFTVPAGTTGERPSSPETGELRFNTDTNNLEQYDGTNWGAVVPDDLDINTLSINGTQVVDSTGNVDTGSLSISGSEVIDSSGNITNVLSFNGYTPADASVQITTGTGLSGGGDLSANRTISADIATSAEAITATSDSVLMTPAKTLESINENVSAGTTNAIAFFL